MSSCDSWLFATGSNPLTPTATSPSAMPWISSSCIPTKSAICLNVSVVLSTSQTAVARAIIGLAIVLLLIQNFPEYKAFPMPDTQAAFSKAGYRCRGTWMTIYRHKTRKERANAAPIHFCYCCLCTVCGDGTAVRLLCLIPIVVTVLVHFGRQRTKF